MPGFAQEAGAVPVMDYEGSDYETEFWTGQGRDYEDAAERLALGRLLPVAGRRIAEIGAGFGRLADLYQGYDQILLVDYSRTLLQEAARRWGHDPRFVFVAGNIYQLPLAGRVLDTLIMVRVMHHLADVPSALAQLRRVVHEHSTLVLEYANKRNLKALARWAARRQPWSPLERAPVEFVPLNFDFHPTWMEERLGEAWLPVRQRFAVSHFRLNALKRKVAPQRLAQVDSALFHLGGRYPLAPSVFVQAEAPRSGTRANIGTLREDIAHLFACPACGHEGLEWAGEEKVCCPACGASYARQQQVWDFKRTVE
jgi:SAM-dependent methyltransferase